jgi:hypothetical protein
MRGSVRRLGGLVILSTIVSAAPAVGDDDSTRRAEDAAIRAEAAAQRSEAAAVRTEQAIERIEKLLDALARQQGAGKPASR